MTWEEYLISKKIDSADFKKNQPEVWLEWRALFEQIHPNSFTAQKLYLINPIRRRYVLKEDQSNQTEHKRKQIVNLKIGAAKPKMGRRKTII